MADDYSFENIIIRASDLFREHFNNDPDICACGPGRVNLIGEHTDYNEGFVLPMALPMITVMIGKKTSNDYCRIITSCPAVDDPKEIKFEVGKGNPNISLHPGKPAWANYVKGVIMNFKGKICAFDAIITTSVPVGGGLSSSAALEVATYTFLEGLDDESSNIGMTEKILACQKAEHDFAGTPCGIMDQFISFMGKKDHALLLDCRSLKFELIALKSPEIAILITNTNVHHNLAESEYPTRKKQCEKAAEVLGQNSLRDVTLKDLKVLADKTESATAVNVVSRMTEKILACQKAEHDFAGTPCGIMDQFISFMGKKDHALLLDCRSLKFELIALKSPEIAILITNTNVHHNLAESEYPTRKKQCEKAAEVLGQNSLRDVTLKDLKEFKDQLKEEIYRRALHVITEIERTVKAAKALHEEDYALFGKLMQESHLSLRENYEVSCPELDTVVNAALEVEGVFGARMTGGGFGGCTVTLLKASAIQKTIQNIKAKYKNPSFYVCRPGDGAKLIKLPL